MNNSSLVPYSVPMKYFKKIKYNSDTAFALSRLVLFVTAVILLALCAVTYYADKNSDSTTDQFTTSLYNKEQDVDVPINTDNPNHNNVETTQQNDFNSTVALYSGPISKSRFLSEKKNFFH